MRPLRSALCGALVVLGPEKLVKNCENNATNEMPAIASEILALGSVLAVTLLWKFPVDDVFRFSG